MSMLDDPTKIIIRNASDLKKRQEIIFREEYQTKLDSVAVDINNAMKEGYVSVSIDLSGLSNFSRHEVVDMLVSLGYDIISIQKLPFDKSLPDAITAPRTVVIGWKHGKVWR